MPAAKHKDLADAQPQNHERGAVVTLTIWLRSMLLSAGGAQM